MRKTRRGGKRMSVQLPELQTVILRLARQRGMQAADAGDVAQAVLAAVAKPVERREHDPERARFRTWLHRVDSSGPVKCVILREASAASEKAVKQGTCKEKVMAQGSR